jgi:hypothetical protein
LSEDRDHGGDSRGEPTQGRGAGRSGPARLALTVALALLTALALAAPAYALEQKLTAPDGGIDSGLGASVAVDGDTLALGAPGDDGLKGAVYVFQLSGGSWVNVAKLTASDAVANDRLGYSVAIDGDTIVAGAIDVNSSAGALYTFARTGAAARTQTAKLTATDGAAGDQLGNSVAIDGDTIVAGASLDNTAATSDHGSAYTFASTGATPRNETAKLIASDADTSDQLGASVAIDGDTIVVGAPGDTANQGAAYTFARTGVTPRNETAKLTASDGANGDFLGASVAINGATVAVGASGNDVGANSAQGSVYTFARSGTAARFETANLTASDGAQLDNLGVSVAIDGATIVAGATGDNVVGSDQGSAYTFASAGAAVRTETAKLVAADGATDDAFGASVAVAGETILAGAPSDDVGGNGDQGSASVFSVTTPPPPPADTTPPETTLKGPKKVEQGEKAKFKFTSSEPGSTFSCKLDHKKYKDCSSPRKLKTANLDLGRHTFAVFATDAAGNADPTPAKRKFKVKAS